MQIEPATCPSCGGHYDPLRARAVTVVDGRVRAFCSPACRDRGVAPPPPAPAPSSHTDAHAPIALPRRTFGLPAEYRVLAVAAVTALGAFVALIVVGRHRAAARAPLAHVTGNVAHAAAPPVAAKLSEPGLDVWMQPLAGRHKATHNHVFEAQRDGMPADACADGRCALDIEAAPGDVVMAVHDGVVETVERDGSKGGARGRYVRINHNGGAMASAYLALDGIREDLRPGIPVKLGEPIGTVGGGGRLRFSVRIHDAEGKERFINPEPLLALWPSRRRASTSLHGMERAPADETVARAPRIDHPRKPRPAPVDDDAPAGDDDAPVAAAKAPAAEKAPAAAKAPAADKPAEKSAAEKPAAEKPAAEKPAAKPAAAEKPAAADKAPAGDNAAAPSDEKSGEE